MSLHNDTARTAMVKPHVLAGPAGTTHYHDQEVRRDFRAFPVVDGSFRLHGKRLVVPSTHTVGSSLAGDFDALLGALGYRS